MVERIDVTDAPIDEAPSAASRRLCEEATGSAIRTAFRLAPHSIVPLQPMMYGSQGSGPFTSRLLFPLRASRQVGAISPPASQPTRRGDNPNCAGPGTACVQISGINRSVRAPSRVARRTQPALAPLCEMHRPECCMSGAATESNIPRSRAMPASPLRHRSPARFLIRRTPSHIRPVHRP
ncbi:hypothetical protein PsYK624_075630 [Phanerochaete sordida]|uniref:Uncharacterized protein n=1 Tax=Phanerochaete sordida TaxID=48140 RepID=A0A9P3G8P8_9APHY|nr:hypothetical protein PsYK624_075630 [Phanerochaete sordida]